MVIISGSGISKTFLTWRNLLNNSFFTSNFIISISRGLIWLFLRNPCIYVICPIFLRNTIEYMEYRFSILRYPCLLTIYSVSFQRQFSLNNFCAYYIVYFFFACLVICYWIYGTYCNFYLLCDICIHIYIYMCYI